MAGICVVGEWHQALVVGAALASLGHRVRGGVSSGAVADALRAGRLPIHEPGLDEAVASGVRSGALGYTAEWGDALAGAEFAFLSIDTPIGDDDAPQLDSLFAAACRIGDALAHDLTLVVTAQVPVGTSAALADTVAQRSGRRIDVCYVPEFLRLGQALQTFFEADRFIVGCDDAAAGDRVAALYEPLGRPVLRTDTRSAEMAKHASNAFLALSISFANEVADLCEAAGADIEAVTAGMKLDRRIGPHAFLGAGLGFAGGTLGRDVRALQALGRTGGRATLMCDAVMGVNDARPSFVARQLLELLGGLAGRRTALWGLTYKPGTSTMRRSVALRIMRELSAAGAEITAFDPLADMRDAEGVIPHFDRTTDPYEAAAGADAVVIVTEWDGLRDVDLARVRTRMRGNLLLDTRNAVADRAAAAAGFRCVRPGRPAARPLEAAP